MKVHLSHQCITKNETQKKEINEQIGEIITEIRDIWTECQNMFFCNLDGDLETKIAQCFVFFLREKDGRAKLNRALQELRRIQKENK